MGGTLSYIGGGGGGSKWCLGMFWVMFDGFEGFGLTLIISCNITSIIQ